MANPLSATVPISLVKRFLVGADQEVVERLAERSGISRALLHEPGARVTQEQFSTLYRLLANELDDEMPGIFSRPFRSGTLKYLCLSLLDAPRLEVSMHRFSQFLHLILDDFKVECERDAALGRVTLVPTKSGYMTNALGCELLLKCAHGVASWLIGQKIPLLAIEFSFPKPLYVGDYPYLFPGPVRFDAEHTCMSFEASYMDMPIRRHKTDLQDFLARAPEDWIFVTFAEQMMCHRVRHYIAGCLPEVATIEATAQALNHSVRTLCRRLTDEGTTFQAIKNELRRDIAIQRLTRTDDTIAAIADDIGFDDSTAFHRAFRSWTGSTPQAYRKVQ
ncbi:AraC family transcriptional regulator [Paraburkholderia megapolitana]|uniref:AraC family transcriptional regulator n=1 Tax=Paraburkholderia megapolitana TaxID=420953 RepID=UPI0038BDADD7